MIETGEFQHFEGQRSFVNRIRPVCDGTPTIKIGTRDNQTDSVSWSVPYSLNSYDSTFSVRESGRYIKYQLTIDAFTRAQGIEVFPVPAGVR